VNTLRSALSETNEQWELFDVHNGDAGYFSDSALSSDSSSSTDNACNSNYDIPDDGSKHRLKPLLCEIREHFQKLRKVQRGFDALSALCKDSSQAVSFHSKKNSGRSLTIS